MVKWIRSKMGVKLLVILSITLLLSMFYLIYMSRWLVAEMERAYQTLTVLKDAGPAAVQRAMETVATGFVSTTLLFILCSLVIVAGFSIGYLLRPMESADTELLEKKENDFGDDTFLDEAFLNDDIEPDEHETVSGFLEENGTGILAHSYNKMVEALQRINELEKEHSIELADANRQLQREITERKRAEREIRYLSSRLISGIEEGRKNLAQDLHDEFGQTLTALHLGAETLRNTMPEELAEQRGRIDSLVALIEQLGDKIRNISSDLRPDLLDDLGLIPTLEWYIDEFSSQRPDLKVDFQSIGLRKRLSLEIELVLYRVFQEALNNVIKHAKAKQFTVTLTYSHPKVIFILKDDGIGFEQDKSTDGIGLLGMRERVVSVNGSIAILSGRGKGTTIRVELPVNKEENFNGKNQGSDR